MLRDLGLVQNQSSLPWIKALLTKAYLGGGGLGSKDNMDLMRPDLSEHAHKKIESDFPKADPGGAAAKCPAEVLFLSFCPFDLLVISLAHMIVIALGQ